MQRTSVERVKIVHAIVCDRCGARARRSRKDNAFKQMASIGFTAEEGSIFEEDQRIEIDLCDPCLRHSLGSWLRVWSPTEEAAGEDLAAVLCAFDPERHGGEFPGRQPQGLDDVFRSLAVADAEEAVAEAADDKKADAQSAALQTPPAAPDSIETDAWVPISELFNRLADGATLEQIVQTFPAISKNAACGALPEAALRFPPYASFHSAVEVWTPRYPYER